jgi:protease I
MDTHLNGKKIAILATDGFEQAELEGPRHALDEAGALTMVISPKSGEIQGFNHFDRARMVEVDATLDDVNADEFDALVLPGGALNPDHLRTVPKAVEFVKKIAEQGKPIAAICHGPWTLIEADLVRGRTLTSWPSIKTDLRNAGATWVDQEVAVDGQFVTSRKPDDIPAFCREMLSHFAGGQAQGKAA